MIDRLAPATQVVAAGRPPRRPGAPVNVPVDWSSTDALAPESPGYGRYENATWTAFEQVLGELKGGAALVHGSGMAAISAALTLLPPDGALVAPSVPYTTTGALLGELAASGRVLRLVDGDDTGGLVAALEGASAVWLESPTNPLLQTCDLPAVVAAARRRGVLVLCDNTLATPLLQRPLLLGADVVVHSVTKYLSGHADLVLGATVCRDDERGARLHERCMSTALATGRSPGPWRRGWPFAASGRCTCASSGPVPTPASWPGGSPGTRPWSGCATRGGGRWWRSRCWEGPGPPTGSSPTAGCGWARRASQGWSRSSSVGAATGASPRGARVAAAPLGRHRGRRVRDLDAALGKAGELRPARA